LIVSQIPKTEIPYFQHLISIFPQNCSHLREVQEYPEAKRSKSILEIKPNIARTSFLFSTFIICIISVQSIIRANLFLAKKLLQLQREIHHLIYKLLRSFSYVVMSWIKDLTLLYQPFTKGHGFPKYLSAHDRSRHSHLGAFRVGAGAVTNGALTYASRYFLFYHSKRFSSLYHWKALHI